MQIHEITAKRAVNEGFMDQLKLAGKAFKDPSIATSNSKFATAQADIKLQNATKDFAKRTAAEWVKQGAQLTAADAIKLKTQPTAQTAAQSPGARMPKVQATQPSGIPPTPNIQGGSELQKAQAAGSSARLAVGDTRSELQIAAEPNSIAQRQIDQEPNKPAVPGAPLDKPISIGGQKLNPKNPKDAQLIAKLKSQGNLEEAFADLPGTKAQAGGTVDPKVTATTVGKQGNPLTSAYITKFKEWVNQKLTTRETSTGQTITLSTVLDKLPDLGRSINQSLTAVYNTRNDPTQNQSAVENFLMTVATGFQQTAALIRKENPDAVAKAATSTAKKRISADPQTERVMQAIGMADSGLDTLADIVSQKGEKVTNKTGSNTIDRLLTAAGLI